MSFDTLRHDRKVKFLRYIEDETDDHGNPILKELDGPELRARRALVTSEENTVDRDEQYRLFTYFFRPDVELTGRDRFVDDGLLYDVIGQPEIVTGNRRAHHIELKARLVEG